MIKKCYLFIFLLPFVIFGDVKIGYIDSNELLENYRGKDELREKLQSQIEKWEKRAMDLRQRIENAIKEYDSQSLLLSESARLRKRREIEDMQKEYEEFIQKIWGPDGEAKKLNDEIMRPFVNKVNEILQNIGKEENYTIIFDAATTGIVYVKEGMNLTPRVLEELNAEYVASATDKEKFYFCVFKFKELTTEAREHNHGTELRSFMKAAFIKAGKFEEVIPDKLTKALMEANIGKPEEEFTIEEASQVGKLAGAKYVVCGEVTRIGEKIDVVCRVIDTDRASLVAEERATSPKADREDLISLVGEIVSKITLKILK